MAMLVLILLNLASFVGGYMIHVGLAKTKEDKTEAKGDKVLSKWEKTATMKLNEPCKMQTERSSAPASRVSFSFSVSVSGLGFQESFAFPLAKGAGFAYFDCR